MGEVRRRRRASRARFVGLVAAFVLVLTVGLPAGFGSGNGQGWSMSWLWSWLDAGRGWASMSLDGIPRQGMGVLPNPGDSHYVPASATRARGGSGRAPQFGTGLAAASVPSGPATKPSTTGPNRAVDPFNARTSRRVAAAATATADVFANSDGSYTRHMFTDPINFQAADGSWQSIDRSLAGGTDGRLHQKASIDSVDFAASAADAALVTVRTAQLSATSVSGSAGSGSTGSGPSVSYALVGAANVPGVVDGDTVTYAGVLPGVDLRETAVTGGVKESLVLASATDQYGWP
jgi:hypothetical protein